MKFFALAVLTVSLILGITLMKREQTLVNPLSTASVVNSQFDGEVQERIEAGSYVYLRVLDEQGNSHWLATLRQFTVNSRQVSVHVFARAEQFESARTGRVFAPLLFASVTTPTQEQK